MVTWPEATVGVAFLACYAFIVWCFFGDKDKSTPPDDDKIIGDDDPLQWYSYTETRTKKESE